LCSLPSNLRLAFGAQNLSPRRAAAPSERLRSLVLAVVGAEVLDFLPRGDLGHTDGVADHVGGALLAFRSLGHQSSSPCRIRRSNSSGRIRLRRTSAFLLCLRSLGS